MKKIIAFACAVIITATSFAKDITVSEKVQKAFETTFTDAENVVWSSADNVYSVHFTQSGVLTYVNYDDKGTFISSVRYYQNAKLPIDIQCKLQKNYAGKTVFGVTESTVGENVFYYVKLEDAKSWTSLRINNARSIEVLDTYSKL